MNPILPRLIRKVLTAPARLADRLDESIKRSHCIAHSQCSLYPPSRIANLQSDPQQIRIGARSRILGELLIFAHAGRIVVGENCFVGENSRIWSALDVRIGDRVLISHDVNIHDTLAHPMSARARAEQTAQIFDKGHPKQIDLVCAPVVIEDDAWIGFGATVLKGVTVGKGAVVGAGAIVTHDVPPFAIVVGNPARQVGMAEP